MSLNCFSCRKPRDFELNENYAICNECGCISFNGIAEALSIVKKIDCAMEGYHSKARNLIEKQLKNSISVTIEEKIILDKINQIIELRKEIEFKNLYTAEERGKKLYKFKKLNEEIVEFFDRSKE